MPGRERTAPFQAAQHTTHLQLLRAVHFAAGLVVVPHFTAPCHRHQNALGREEGREGGREGEREGGKEEGREKGRE